jgi:hypothetical protein
MASDTGKAIGSVTRGDFWGLPPEKIKIAQEDPSHPAHKWHMARVNLANPAFVALLEAIRVVGWQTGSACFAFVDKDEEGNKTAVAATAKRRVTAARIVNEEWKRANDPRYPIVVPLVLTKDPVMAENIENSLRVEDPPLVRARRFLASVDVLGEQAAAASNGFTLKDAHAAVELLKADPELQGAINRLEIPLDTATRISKQGRAKALEALGEATEPETGKIDKKKIKKAAVQIEKSTAKRPKVMAAVKVVEMKKALKKAEVDDKFVALLDYMLGKKNALDAYPSLYKAVFGKALGEE